MNIIVLALAQWVLCDSAKANIAVQFLTYALKDVAIKYKFIQER